MHLPIISSKLTGQLTGDPWPKDPQKCHLICLHPLPIAGTVSTAVPEWAFIVQEASELNVIPAPVCSYVNSTLVLLSSQPPLFSAEQLE